MALGKAVSDLMMEIGIDVNDSSFKEFEKTLDKSFDGIKDKAKNATAGIGNAFKNAMPAIGKATGTAVVGLGKAAGAGIAAVGAGVAGVGLKMVHFGDEYNKAMGQLQASTGATDEEIKKLGENVKNVYATGLGESIEDVANSMAIVNKQINLTGKELENATKSGIALRDTFGFEMEESTRAVSSLMKQFGIDAEKAYGIIAVGAQEGADQNGDLLDTLNEYSNHYASLGLSADEFLTSLTTAADIGVFSIDKVGDAVKEFGIRAKDGSTGTVEAFTALGLNAEQMGIAFNKGGEVAKNATFQVIEALKAMEDPMERNNAGVALFGTMYEDLGPNVLDILSSMNGATVDTTKALENINKVKYNNLGDALNGIKRSLEVGLLPVASEVANELTDIMGEFNSLLSDGFQAEDITQLGEILTERLVGGLEKIKDYIPAIVEMLSATIQEIVGILVELLPEVMPIIADGAMDLLQGVIDTVLDNIEPIMNMVVEIVTTIADFIIQNLPLLIEAAVQIVVALATGLAESVDTLIPSIILAITTITNTLLENLPALISAAFILIQALAFGLIDALPTLIGELPKIIMSIVDFIAQNLPEIIGMGIEIIIALAGGLIQALPELLGSVDDILLSLLSAMGGIVVSVVGIGKNIVEGLWKGIKSMGGWIKDKVTGFFGGITDSVKGFLGIKSPSRLYAGIGGYMAEGIGVGFDGNMDTVAKEMEKRIPSDFDIDTNITETSKRSVVTAYTGTAEGTVNELKRQQEREVKQNRKNSGSPLIVQIKNAYGDKQGMMRLLKDFKDGLEELGLEIGDIIPV